MYKFDTFFSQWISILVKQSKTKYLWGYNKAAVSKPNISPSPWTFSIWNVKTSIFKYHWNLSTHFIFVLNQYIYVFKHSFHVPPRGQSVLQLMLRPVVLKNSSSVLLSHICPLLGQLHFSSMPGFCWRLQPNLTVTEVGWGGRGRRGEEGSIELVFI